MPADLRRRKIVVKTPSLTHLTGALVSARLGSPVRVLLEGERGTGRRSAIDYALENHPARRELIVLRGSADQFRSPLSPIAEAFSCLLEMPMHEDRVKRAAANLANDLTQLVPFLGTFDGNVKELKNLFVGRGTALPATEPADLLFRIQRFLRNLALEFHPVLVFVDLEQYDHSTLSILSHIARKTDLDCTLIFGYDPFTANVDNDERFLAFESALTSQCFFKKVKFSRFTLQEAARFVDGLLGRGTATNEQVLCLYEKTGGNPLFLRELIAHLVDEGFLLERLGQRYLCDGYGAATLPHSLRDLIVLKLRQLPPELRSVVDLASVIGTEFSSEPISEGLQLAHLLVLDRLRRLESGYNLIEQMSRNHRFSLTAVREAIYENLGPALAREHHLLLAKYFERHPEHTDVHYLLFYHYSRSFLPEMAITHLIRSAYSARAQMTHEEAAYRFRVASELLLRGGEHTLDYKVEQMKLEEAISYHEAGQFALVASILEKLISRPLHRNIRATSLLYLSIAQYMLGHPETSCATLENLFATGIELLPEDLKLQATLTKASVLNSMGRWKESRHAYLGFIKRVPKGSAALLSDVIKRINMFYLPDLALPLLKRAQDQLKEKGSPLYWEIHHNIGGNHLLQGNLRAAERHFEEALGAFENLGTYRAAFSLNNLGLTAMLSGDHHRARELFTRFKEVARLEFEQIAATCHLSVLDCLSGVAEKAVCRLEPLLERAQSMRETEVAEVIYHNLAWAHLLAGHPLKAAQYLREAPDITKNLWADFRLARRHRVFGGLANAIQLDTSILDRTARKDSWMFKALDYEVYDIWCWE